MERTTERLDGWVVRNGCRKSCYACNGVECAYIYPMIDRLATYEDIGTPEEINRIIDAYGRGLTLRTDVGERLELIRDIQTERLMEIAQAEKDGRLVVLPCKSDTVYTIEEDYFNCSECIHGSRVCFKPEINRVSCDMDCGVHCPFYIKEHEVSGFEIGFDMTGNAVLSHPGEFGYEGLEQFAGIDSKVYYTREEAEAALKKREEDNETN